MSTKVAIPRSKMLPHGGGSSSRQHHTSSHRETAFNAQPAKQRIAAFAKYVDETPSSATTDGINARSLDFSRTSLIGEQSCLSAVFGTIPKSFAPIVRCMSLSHNAELCDNDGEAAKLLFNSFIPAFVPKLISLDLFSVGMDDRSMPHLCAFLEQPGCTLQKVKIGDNKIACRGASQLAACLRKAHQVTQLHLGGNSIGDQGAQAILAAVSVSNVKSLGLRGCGLTMATGPAVAQALVSAPNLTELQLRNNALGDSVLIAFAEACEELAFPPKHVTVRTLELQDNKITPVGGDALLRAVQAAQGSNSSSFGTFVMTAFELGQNPLLGDKFCSSLATMLTSSTPCRLALLDLHDCGISEAGCKALASALPSAPSGMAVSSLTLSKNAIGSGAEALAAALLEQRRARAATAMTTTEQDIQDEFAECHFDGQDEDHSNKLADGAVDVRRRSRGLLSLKLSACQIPPKAFASILSAMTCRASDRQNSLGPSFVKVLDLSQNFGRREGGMALLEFLRGPLVAEAKRPSSIVRLLVPDCELPERCCTEFPRALLSQEPSSQLSLLLDHSHESIRSDSSSDGSGIPTPPNSIDFNDVRPVDCLPPISTAFADLPHCLYLRQFIFGGKSVTAPLGNDVSDNLRMAINESLDILRSKGEALREERLRIKRERAALLDATRTQALPTAVLLSADAKTTEDDDKEWIFAPAQCRSKMNVSPPSSDDQAVEPTSKVGLEFNGLSVLRHGGIRAVDGSSVCSFASTKASTVALPSDHGKRRLSNASTSMASSSITALRQQNKDREIAQKHEEGVWSTMSLGSAAEYQQLLIDDLVTARYFSSPFDLPTLEEIASPSAWMFAM